MRPSGRLLHLNCVRQSLGDGYGLDLASQEDVAPGFHIQEFKVLAGEGTPEMRPGRFIEEVGCKSHFKFGGKTL